MELGAPERTALLNDDRAEEPRAAEGKELLVEEPTVELAAPDSEVLVKDRIEGLGAAEEKALLVEDCAVDGGAPD